jgi:hypothetical protein
VLFQGGFFVTLPLAGLGLGLAVAIGILVAGAVRSRTTVEGSVVTVRMIRSQSIDLATARSVRLELVRAARTNRASMLMIVVTPTDVVRVVVPDTGGIDQAADLVAVAAALGASRADGAAETITWMNNIARRLSPVWPVPLVMEPLQPSAEPRRS